MPGCGAADVVLGLRYRRYRENDLVLLDIKINGEMVEPLAAIVHRDNAYYVSRGKSRPPGGVVAPMARIAHGAAPLHLPAWRAGGRVATGRYKSTDPRLSVAGLPPRWARRW